MLDDDGYELPSGLPAGQRFQLALLYEAADDVFTELRQLYASEIKDGPLALGRLADLTARLNTILERIEPLDASLAFFGRQILADFVQEIERAVANLKD